MAWKFTPNRPIYLQLVDEIEARILNGTYEKGMRLPSVRELAMLAAVNPNTMQRALSELEGMGLVSTQRTSGRSVTTEEAILERAREKKAQALIGTFLAQISALGLTKAEVLDLLKREEAKEEQHGSNS